ncbi:protein ABHD8-like isoform X2 [Cylas formicarius]|uniref:protein ABHD8-like isoform X2 n=1 Tax=Cylas formicarius TaxID=197179 RepID=UPI002958D7C8|nr:protein ABHD8-like isoform X2 [Cylas formicarius]
MTEETPIQINGCIPKVVNSWRSRLTTLNTGHRIHPLEPVPANNCEYIVIDSKIRIRVIHVSPENQRKCFTIPKEFLSKRSSLSEEYWFTHNKPLRSANCNCSFRRSLRYSVISNEPVPLNEAFKQSLRNPQWPPTKIKDVETFVQHLIQETFYEAFQEYYARHKESGEVNAAYETTEADGIVTLLKKKTPVTEKPQGNAKKQCVHKRKTQKQLIFMLHGIGASAEIWSALISNLSSKGFEVAAPDMLGHGYSSAPKKSSYYTFKNLLLQLIEIFDYYMGNDKKRKCILIGHSYGCSLITALYPHRALQISQLILLSSGGPTPLAPPAGVNQISPYGCVHNVFYPLLYCGLKRSFFYSSRGKHFTNCTKESAVPNYILDFFINGQNWPEGDAAFHRRIMAPTLLVHGLQDTKINLVQECEMERTIPRAFLELIPNAGHLSMLETPEQLTHMILCFLDMFS